ncbi:MAG: hypothetical protein NVSMB30_11850 [Hymenobacter sp.]
MARPPQKAPPASTEIFGEWQWVSSVGGFTGKAVYTPANTGGERTYRFNRDSTFVEYYKNQYKVVPVKFTMRMEKSFFDHQQHLILTIPRRIYLARPDTGFHVIRFRYTVREVSDTLRLDEEMADGFEESYRRK